MLKPMCVPQMARAPKVAKLREVRSLTLTISEAHRWISPKWNYQFYRLSSDYPTSWFPIPTASSPWIRSNWPKPKWRVDKIRSSTSLSTWKTSHQMPTIWRSRLWTGNHLPCLPTINDYLLKGASVRRTLKWRSWPWICPLWSPARRSKSGNPCLGSLPSESGVLWD